MLHPPRGYPVLVVCQIWTLCHRTRACSSYSKYLPYSSQKGRCILPCCCNCLQVPFQARLVCQKRPEIEPDWPPKGRVLAPHIICISLKFLHTSPRETPICYVTPCDHAPLSVMRGLLQCTSISSCKSSCALRGVRYSGVQLILVIHRRRNHGGSGGWCPPMFPDSYIARLNFIHTDYAALAYRSIEPPFTKPSFYASVIQEDRPMQRPDVCQTDVSAIQCVR